MMHHPNMHHQPMSGHPPQHHPAHQGMPTHHQMPPHQMHRESRHLPMHRVGMGAQGSGAGMGAHGQPMGGMGSMQIHHGPSQRPPHTLRPMHAPPQQHHSMPPQMKQMRRGFQGNGYSASGPGVMYQQPPPMQTPQPPPERQSTSSCPPPPTAAPQTQTEHKDASTTENELKTDDLSLLANSKEKTPMCLVNELARYNKIKHQYRLTSETGPAHKKVFTVTLRLGETEEYTAEGSSIKRAQHAAASAALGRTRFPAPPPRAHPPSAHAHLHRHNGTVMPTVELNALAMKLCQPAIYTSIPPIPGPNRPPRPRPPPGMYRMPPPFNHPQSNRLPTPGMIYRVKVAVGSKEWLGEGSTPQGARHDAAAKALQDMRPIGEATPMPLVTVPVQDCDTADIGTDILNSDLKSPVSLVHELALKRNLSVVFTVKSERGPPHMRVFITLCTVGEMETEGEGNGKKVSKRRAAEKMLEEMRQSWPPALLRARPPPPQVKRKQHATKKKPRNLIKESGAGDSVPDGGGGGSDSGGAAGDNPISRLAMARHAVRARSPQYSVVSERGQARRREFVVECSAPPHRATGLGPNKKTAKRRAALHVLLAMESVSKVVESSDAPTCSGDSASVKASSPKPADTKRKDSESPEGGAAGDARQPVPGVLMMDYQKRSGQPPTPNGVSETSATGGGGASNPGSKEQLLYLAQLLGFTVEFSDFPKRNHGEYLSLVSLSTCPPVMCHGAGGSTALSHEQCARAALRALALMGLDAESAPSAATPASTATPAATTTTTTPPIAVSSVSANTTKTGVLSNGISE